MGQDFVEVAGSRSALFVSTEWEDLQGERHWSYRENLLIQQCVGNGDLSRLRPCVALANFIACIGSCFA